MIIASSLPSENPRFSKCFLSTLKREAVVFKSHQFEKRFC